MGLLLQCCCLSNLKLPCCSVTVFKMCWGSESAPAYNIKLNQPWNLVNGN